MQVKRLFALSALVIAAGTAAAETVSTEVWVIPPAVFHGAVNRADVVAERQRSAGIPTAAPEVWFGSKASAGVNVGAVARNDVRADLNMWRRAGLEMAAGDSIVSNGPAHAKRIAAYQAARENNAYAAGQATQTAQ